MLWPCLLAAFILLVTVTYWLLVTTEGVFLGRRVVVWLYDITAHRYDRIKQFDAEEEKLLVTNPVLETLVGRDRPLLLDVATGTGRVPVNLLHDGRFKGFLVGLDASAEMLQVAADKLADFSMVVNLVQAHAGSLPFAAATFDAITCLEALEFLPSDEHALRQMARVLLPGGSLVTTRRRDWEGRLFFHRYRSEAAFASLLHRAGFSAVRFYHWEVGYDLALARKPGE